MTSIDEQLQQVISHDRIYTNKLVAHLDWSVSTKHLVVATTILEKRFILIDQYDDIDRLKSLCKNLYFYEVVRESEEYKRYPGLANCIYESDWLGHFSFVLKTNKFDNQDDRLLIEQNDWKLIYLKNVAVETVESLNMDLRVGLTNKTGYWGFAWVRHDHPFYMEEGMLCPRKNCVTDRLGIIWGTREQADSIMEQIAKITRKFNRKGSHFNSYPTVQDFLDDFLSLMKQISNKTMPLAGLAEWSMKVLSGYSVV